VYERGVLPMIIIDVEIKKAIQGRNEEQLEGIEYCEGWRDFANMGIACVCTYDITTHLTRVFLEEDFNALAEYLYGKWTAGFNTKRFDLPLLAANDLHFDAAVHYDILEEIWLALGLNPDKFNPRTHGGWGLDAVCQATLGIRKTGHGALAPVWWQQGKRGQVIDYCCNDVWMEGSLLRHVLQGGPVFNRLPSDPLNLSRPLEWMARQVAQTEQIIGRQYGALQAKAFAEASDKAGIAAVAGAEQGTTTFTGGLGIKR
jgi:hypothetical protein